MLWNATNGHIAQTNYIRFGSGKRTLVIIPGLGDGLQTVKGTALPMAWMYRIFAKDFTVYMFSRKDTLPRGVTTRNLARDLAEVMAALRIQKADVLGVSMGGMIAQWLAIDYPQLVNKLVLTVTSATPNPVIRASIGEWTEFAERGDHGALMESNLRKIYSDEYYRQNKWLIPLIAVATKPKSYERFLIQAEACLTHDALSHLARIQAETLIIGGEKDQALSGDASRELARGISGSRLKMYDQWGHGLYEEAKDFNTVVKAFLLETAAASE